MTAKTARRLAKMQREAASTSTLTRKHLLRITDLVTARTKEIVVGVEPDGLEIYNRVQLTHEDRLLNLQAARVWCARTGNELRHLENQLDRAIDLAERQL